MNFTDDIKLSKEIKLIEYSRSLMMTTLHNLINVYGQDLKNEQWALEPLADIVISFSILYSGFLRYIKIDNNDLKEKTLPVLKYSIDRHFIKLFKNTKDINNYIIDKIDNNDKECYYSLINEYEKLNYSCNSIDLKKIICSEFYKNGKYYLD